MDFRKYERGYAEIQPNNKLNTGFNVRKNENIPVYKWDYLKKNARQKRIRPTLTS